MPSPPLPPRTFPQVSGWTLPAQWALLGGLSLLLVGGLELLHLPAALMIGTMAAAVLLALAGTRIRVPGLPFQFAQGLIGLMIASALTPSTLTTLGRDWPLFLAVIVAVITASNGAGWLLARVKLLPGSTAIWGAAPGAASVMTLMAAEFGADIRLVAFMQYFRVFLVTLSASLVAHFWVGVHGSPPSPPWFPALEPSAFVSSLALVGVGALLARPLGIPAGAMILPLFAGALLQDLVGTHFQLPPWLLAISYALVGWSIGLRFTLNILRHAARALPALAVSILGLMLLCGGFAAILVWAAGIDPLTAYLATSPGGADAVAIIAASSRVDLPFVMALQTGRFLVVLVTGPYLARWLARRLPPHPPSIDSPSP